MTLEPCGTFVKPSFPLSASRNASCPFDERVCRSNTSNVEVDTGLLNSYFDFGVNTAPQYRLQFRQKVSCAPLELDGYSKLVNNSRNSASPGQNDLVMQYFYGKASSQQKDNLSYQYPYIRANVSEESLSPTSYGHDYTLG